MNMEQKMLGVLIFLVLVNIVIAWGM